MKNITKKLLLTLVVLCLVVLTTSCTFGQNNPPKDEDATYTYNDYTSGSPDTWNPHQWQTNEDSYIMGFIESGLYEFILNETKDGYDIVPEMAAAEPVDVTSVYAGDERFGVPADAASDAGYAYRIALNPAAVWQDGTAINADTYVYSMEQLLNPKNLNYRADSYYAGSLIIANAKNYFDSSKPIVEPKVYYCGDDACEVCPHVNEKYTDQQLYISLTRSDNWGSYSFKVLCEDYGYVDAELYSKLAELEDTFGYIAYNEETKEDIDTMFAQFLSAFGYTLEELGQEAYDAVCEEFFYFYTGETSEGYDWDNVGIKKVDEYTIDLVLANPLKGFDLFYNLSGNWIVYQELYESCKTEIAGTDGYYSSTYGTSLDTTMSYGPYRLSEYQLDKVIHLTKNEKWYGYTDGKHEGQYQTTDVHCVIIPTHATAMLEFLKGNLDGIGLDADDMKTYRSSEYINYTPQTYTTKLSFNSDAVKLGSREEAGVDKQILSVLEFRKALSLCIDRDAFCAACTASHVAGFGLFNYMYVTDAETGTIYRETEQGQEVFKKLYGVSSIEGLTGYDKDAATALFQEAYDKAAEAGYISSGDRVELEFLVYQGDESYQRIVSFIQEEINEATVGTSLEGKVTVKLTVNADYYEAMQAGNAEIILSTWGGAQYNPFGITDSYLNADEIFEYGFDTNQELTIVVEGVEVTYTLEQWNVELNQGKYVTASVETKTDILAALEYFVLSQYCTTPIYYRTSASLDSMKVESATDTYINLVGFGGIRFMTYNYTDAQWAEFCKQNNYQLDYAG